MRKIAFVVLASLIGLCSSTFGQRPYEPPKVLSADDAYLAYLAPNDGFYVFDVSLTDDGKIEQIGTLRTPSGATFDGAKISINSWKFEPAAQGPRDLPSRLTAVFVYRPPNFDIVPAEPPKDFVPVIPPRQTDDHQKSDYVPVGIVAFNYPEYPVNSIARGSVIVQVTVNEAGKVVHVTLLHSMAGFNHLVTDVLGKWQFRAATLEGKPITAPAVIAFVFQPLTSTN